MLALQLTICQTIELALTGGTTESIFPEAEELLQSHTDYQKALEYIGRRKDMDRYESVMDFLFCELHTEWRTRCFRYYLDRKKPLRKVLTDGERLYYAAKIVMALEVAKQAWERDLVKSWRSFKQLVDEVEKVA